jgi:hypothetical protein
MANFSFNFNSFLVKIGEERLGKFDDLFLTKPNNQKFIFLFINSRASDLNKADISANKVNQSKEDFHFLQSYANSKMCLTLFAFELNRRLNKMKNFGLFKIKAFLKYFSK